MTIDKSEIEKYFSVGDVVTTGGGHTKFRIIEFREKIEIKPTEGETRTLSFLKYDDLIVVIENIKKIDPKNIKSSVCTILNKDLFNTSYLYGMAKEYLKRKESHLLSSSHVQNEFESAVEKSKQSNSVERQKRLENASKKPEKITTTSVTFKRNPDVVAEVLERADGICEECKKPAPFIKKSDNTPYLEVHHKKRLAGNGDDSVENAIALCPNCHRKAHFG